MTAPLTLGTAGHIDHGKTCLVRALTGVETDRLAEERRRGISIVLGYAPLRLPSGRRLSVVDVPGHERFVRTMVAGATGIDLYLLVVAADDGVMPQTREHATVLAALGVRHGVVAITKADLADPRRATDEAVQLLADELGSGAEIVACSTRSGQGIDAVTAALDRVAARLPGRAARGGPAILHVDRAFTIHGAGTVVTGTLWSGAIATGDRLAILPRGTVARARSIQVHNARVERAEAGQRVAVNLAGVRRADVERGDVLCARDADLRPTRVLDCELHLSADPGQARVHVHHGTREAPGRLVELGDGLWQARLERSLLAAAGDHVVVRSVAPPDTLGGGTVLDPRARRHGAREDLRERLERLRRGEPEPAPRAPAASPARAAAPPPLSDAALALEARLRAAGYEPPLDSQLGGAAAHLADLRAHERAVRLGPAMHAHPDAIAAVRDRVIAIVEAEGGITLARLRDDLGTSRKYAQALLEHLDAAHVTLRLPDNRRVLRGRR